MSLDAGLTGCVEEHRLLACRLASAGFVVALVHHTDGSSSRCPLRGTGAGGGEVIYYDHPDWSNYDPDLRPRQVPLWPYPRRMYLIW